MSVNAEECDMEAFVLIQTAVGEAADVAQELASIDGVQSAMAVTGPYDVIARIQGDNIDALGKLVVSRVQLIAGVTRTLTCPIVRL